MIRLVPAMLLALFAIGAAPPPVIRSVFVGIDQYRYSAGKPGHSGDAEFRDLGGAVNDVMLLKSVLATRWKLPVDGTGPGDACPRVGVSMTLLNACATRAGIITALTTQIAAASPGDTLLFYYSGHGSQALDRSGSQASGRNGTIVPHDSRGGGVHDILDIDLKRLIDAALARGVNFVTIADSCDSGTLTRDLRGGQPRLASPDPLPAGPATDIVPPPPLANTANAYRVLLAASADGETAKEVGTGADRHGVFTTALVAALGELDAPSYADLAAEIRRQIPFDTQTPKAEGALKSAFLGRDRAGTRIFEAESDAPDRVTIGGGSLVGVTPGSTFALYKGRGAPAASTPPLRLASVESVRPGDASLRLAAPLEDRAGPLVAVEREHVAAGAKVVLRVDGGDAAQRQTVADAAAGASGVSLGAGTPTHVLAIGSSGVQLLRASDSAAIGTPFPPAATRAMLAKLTRYNAVMALPLLGGQEAKAGAIDFGLVCARPDDRPPLPQVAGTAIGYAGDSIDMLLSNLGSAPRFAYAIAIDENLEITPLNPDENAAVREGASRTLQDLPLSGDGLTHIVLLLAAAPVDTSALAQAGVRGMAAPRSDLQRLINAAGDGRTSRSIARVDAWSALVVDLLIKPANARKGPRPCPAP